ncbi:MAG: 1-deoxy-D-xylulose-5-phosphate synthase [Pseudomonadota bacterium]
MFKEIPVTEPKTPLLDALQGDYRGIRRLNAADLESLASELREFLLYTVGQTGGHFGAGLGVVELTIAVHHVFELPEDRLVWDVGHQCYPHKILTGRKKAMRTLRQIGGLSGFPKRSESEFDTFGVGHASTALSAAVGMAIAGRYQHRSRRVIAVVGDGALSGGMSFEALSHAGEEQPDVLLIVNDNQMSIGNVSGGLAGHLAQLGSASDLSQTQGFKSMFEPLGWTYAGPVDGHDLTELVARLRSECSQAGPRVLHVKTVKGKGFAPAERDPIGFHSIDKISPRKPASGEVAIRDGQTLKTKQPKFQDVFGQWLCEEAERDERLVAITPAMKEGSGMTEFARRFPDRFFDVAIAEQHAVTLAAGMACEGLKPIVAIYSTFLQRAYDQVIHDVALQELDVTFAIDRAGLVGADGPTHHGSFDISFLGCVPNVIIGCPASAEECKLILQAAYSAQGPAFVRYPRGLADGDALVAEPKPIDPGVARICRRGSGVAILSFGALLPEALEVGQQVNATVVDMRWAKPLDRNLLADIASSHSRLVTLEENSKLGGAGSMIELALDELGVSKKLIHIGLEDVFQEHGSQQTLRANHGLSAERIRSRIEAFLHASNP